MRTETAQTTSVELGNVYAGEVRPRYESVLGFRVNGKILQRLVNVGDAVHTGEVLARIDAADLALSETSSRAAVASQEAQLAVEQADMKRYEDLLRQGFVSQAEYDRQHTRLLSAQAQLDSARAQYRVSANQTGYAELHADHDGVVTSVDAEAGQVVAAGQAVVHVAWSGEQEVAVAIPEDRVDRLKVGAPVDVALWVDPSHSFPGLVRELSASADPATRTYAVRVRIPQPPADMKLGMTASVRLQGSERPNVIRMPVAALVERQGARGVWVFDRQAGQVRFRAVDLAGVAGNEILITGGVHDGEQVVTAGAPLLHDGQKVKPLLAATAS